MRLYAKYPSGPPGMGLVVLRVLVATSLWPVAPVILQALGDPVSFAFAAVLFVAVLVGTYSPVAAAVCLTWNGLALLHTDAESWRPSAVAALECIALALTGPGAYSSDAVFRGPPLLKIRPRQ